VVRADADKEAIVQGIDHALGLAARVIAQRLDRVVVCEQRRRHAIENRRSLRPFHPDRFQFADMLFQRRNIPAGPAGDHQFLDPRQIDRLR
jgi:hypothetical protein